MPRILIVDDDPGTLQTFGAILSLGGHHVELAQTGHEALRLARHHTLDLALVDQRLPDIDGISVLRNLRQQGLNVPLVIMTAFGTDDSLTQAARLGAAACVQKPILHDALLAIVSTHAGSKMPSSAVTSVGHIDRGDLLTASLNEASKSSLSGYAAERWVNLVMVVVEHDVDVATVAEWSRISGHSTATLKARCAAAGVRAGESLDFGRALRAVRLFAGRRCDWYNLLDILDSRTLARFLERAGLSLGSPLPDTRAFLRTQQLILTTHLVSTIGDRLGLASV